MGSGNYDLEYVIVVRRDIGASRVPEWSGSGGGGPGNKDGGIVALVFVFKVTMPNARTVIALRQMFWLLICHGGSKESTMQVQLATHWMSLMAWRCILNRKTQKTDVENVM